MPRNGETISVRADSGATYQYVWSDSPPCGAMKQVYFAPDKSYVVAFFKTPQNANAIGRLEDLVGRYRRGIFGHDGGDYWKNVYCWPTDLVREGSRVGLVVPAYDRRFFFAHNGAVIETKGLEKEGKWFTSPVHHFSYLSPKEIGDWRAYFNICLLLARGVRRMHMAGLAHSDLSYKNVLIDPVTHSATIIDIDGLVVPGKYPPDVVGTPDFIAPEVYETMGLPLGQRKLPCQETDRHALAVLIYMYLLYRHPLRGRKIWDCDDDQRDERLTMGEKAVFIEDKANPCNRYDAQWVRDNYPASKTRFLLPWMDLDRLPYGILGPYLGALIEQAFVKGLHAPKERPTADAWEDALVKTMDLLQPCPNPACPQHWFVFDNTRTPTCPFCGAVYRDPLPVLNLYQPYGSTYKPNGWRVMVFNGTRLYPWHVRPNLMPGEKLTEEERKAVACFQFHKGVWYLRNERAIGMRNLATQAPIPSHRHACRAARRRPNPPGRPGLAHGSRPDGEWPLRCAMCGDRLKAALGSGFGLGLLPGIPGTFGALVGLGWHGLAWKGLAFGLAPRPWCLLGVLLFGALHYGLNAWAQRHWGDPDPKQFVQDEIVGYLCVPLFVPFPFTAGWHLLVGFALFRVLDAIKLPGARYLDRNVHNAHGVLFDDVVSALYAAALMSLLHLCTR